MLRNNWKSSLNSDLLFLLKFFKKLLPGFIILIISDFSSCNSDLFIFSDSESGNLIFQAAIVNNIGPDREWYHLVIWHFIDYDLVEFIFFK